MAHFEWTQPVLSSIAGALPPEVELVLRNM